ncbi:hypothetical protein BU25DRAFT_481645 [Macroventuria anomochaeta]|uniref:Uncharacterized protein n=1 Tax=Macroventuria anomochaeta TaxID=301207 RepID=A0ACB6SC98_9PLEO|nr:uncharacterized protein BU25DRAFT_481645 [Macroventuria anomochaeta]KAF2631137.1 hypothetical protein BU25DRAFT_481645 [Macroventuria anomochaeta]
MARTLGDRGNVMGDWAGPRRDSRHDFSKALISFTALRRTQLDFLYPLRTVESFDQLKQLPNLTEPALFDPFSSSLRLLSCHLRHRRRRNPLLANQRQPTSFVAHMESLTVMFHPSTPSESWCFKGLPGVGATDGYEATSASYPPPLTTDAEYDEHDDVADLYWTEEVRRLSSRVEPNNDILVPFLTAFPKAAASMTKLKEAVLWSPLQSNPPSVEAYDDFCFEQVSNFLDWSDVGLAWRTDERAFMNFPGKDFCSSRQL